MMSLTTTNARREAVLAAAAAHRESEAKIAAEIAKRTKCPRCNGQKRLIVFFMEGPGNPTVPCPDCAVAR